MVRASWVVATLMVAGCIHDDLTQCEGGWVCAHDRVCDEAHHICVAADQVTACDGHLEGDTCRAGSMFGLCRSGVCIAPSCGNRVVEPPDEMCDDGNHTAGDGCSPDCSSDERCGNGVKDPGEGCDDGNLYDKDGCDSRCTAESLVWDAIGINPWPYGASSVWDPERGVMVQWDAGLLWEMNQSGWKLMSIAGPKVTSGTLYFDGDQHRVTLLGTTSAASGLDTVAQWDGTAWTTRSMPTAWSVDTVRAAVWDSAHHRVIAVGARPAVVLGVWDGTTWTEHAFPSDLYPNSGQVEMAYDSGNDRTIVLVDQGSTTQAGTYTFANDMLTGPGAVPPGQVVDWSIVYDPDRPATLVICGAAGLNGTGTIYNTVYQWTGVGWAQVTTAGNGPSPRRRPRLGYDPIGHQIVLAGGVTSPMIEDVYHLSPASTWSLVKTFEMPPRAATSTLVSRPGDLLLIDFGGTVWRYAGTGWTVMTTTTLPPTSTYAYDPGRDATYAFRATSGQPVHTSVLSGTTWMSASDGPTVSGGPQLLATYDPVRRAIVMIVDATYAFDGLTWTRIAALPPAFGAPASLAYERATNSIIYLDTQYSTSLELDATGWHALLSPGIGYRVAASQRRGSVVYAPAQFGVGPVYERMGTTWIQHDPPPLGVYGGYATNDLGTDGLILYGQDSGYGSSFALVRHFVGSGPAESCVAGEDMDGDGLAGCADADCWLVCNPGCPFGTSCP